MRHLACSPQLPVITMEELEAALARIFHEGGAAGRPG
jgi:hypothetical protein